jgi:hypothetical protein
MTTNIEKARKSAWIEHFIIEWLSRSSAVSLDMLLLSYRDTRDGEPSVTRPAIAGVIVELAQDGFVCLAHEDASHLGYSWRLSARGQALLDFFDGVAAPGFTPEGWGRAKWKTWEAIKAAERDNREHVEGAAP